MRNNNVHNLIIEGPDGVGKTTLIKNLFKKYNYRYMCYHRGEISNYIFAKKYNRTYYVTQNRLPFLFIVLICSPYELKERMKKRAKEEHWTNDELFEELTKAEDSKMFIEAAEQMKNQYEIVVIDTTFLNEEEVLDKVSKILDERFDNLLDDEHYTQWNEMYKKGCQMLNRKFKVVENQAYIDGTPINTETTLCNGAYETFSDKSLPDNLIYTLGYGETKVVADKQDYDFQYIINSKINNRPEVLEYYSVFNKAGKSCITSNYETIPKYKNFKRYDRVFGVDYLKAISQAKATVYTAREVEYLKLQTARLYEGIICQNIVFVDKYSDKDNEMLRNIYGEDIETIELLTVTPEDIIRKYNYIMENDNIRKYILIKQNEYLETLIRRNKHED